MHHIENTEHTSAVIVVAILILKKIIVITAVTKWTEVQKNEFNRKRSRTAH